MVVSAVNDVRIAVPATGGGMESVKDTARFKVGIGIASLLALILGLVFLVLDAGKPATAWEIITYGLEYGRWESWMFLGTIFLSVLVFLILIYIWLGGISKIFSKIGSWYVVKSKMFSVRYLLINSNFWNS